MKFKELENSYYLFRDHLNALKEKSDVLEASWERYFRVEISLAKIWEDEIPVSLYPIPLEIKEYAYLGIVKAVDTAVLRALLQADSKNLDIVDEIAKRLPEGAFGREYDQDIINDYFSNGKVEVGL